MIKDIKELNFPPHATLSQATCTLQDMAEKFITTQVKIDGAITPDFSYDWEIEFKGEKYIMPLRQPQAAKENTSLNSTIDLTFQHWAQYQLKRHYFFTIQPIETGTAVADKYIASVSLKLDDFCALFNQVLAHYFNDAITIDLNPNWDFAEEPTTVEISYSYLWDVLIQFYDLWAVRWQIEPNGGPNQYVIKVGYPVAEVDHIFEYGFKGGLLKVERQVQDDNIRNMLLGRGGEKNLPYRYFKDIDPDNPSFPADPDWIPELRNIYFSELRGKTFRDYVRGWKTNPHRQLTDAEGNPIYPYIVTYPENSSVQTQALPKIERSSFYVSPHGQTSINIPGNEPINIPQGYQGNFQNGTIEVHTVYEEYDIYQDTYRDVEVYDAVDVTTEITLIDRNTGETIASADIPAGEYDYNVRFNLQSKYGDELRVDLTYEGLKLVKTPIQEVKPNVGTPISIEPYDEEYAATSWAYKRGHEDEKFDPIEFVKDDTSIVKYGELMGGLENNEEIYPSIQGVTVDPYGRIDEAVDIEQITNDDIKETAESDAVISNIPNGEFSYTTAEIITNATASTTFPKVPFTVPAGKTANLLVLDDIEILKIYVGNKNADKAVNKTNFGVYAQIEKKDVKVYDSTTNEERASVGIPEGSYYYVIDVKVKYISAAYTKAKITVGINTPRIQYSTPQDEKWGNTFDIWIKNIWGSEKKSDETDIQYAERVWRPILGDHEGEEAKVVFSTGMLSTSEDYEFVIAKTPAYDTSKSLNGVPSHWRLTLGKSDADLESTGLYLPSTMRQGKAGDHFFFVGIDMPHQYVLWAEERLDNYKTENLDRVKDIKPTWVVSLDKIRISNKQQGELQPLISQLHVGDSIRLADKRFILNEEGKETAYEILYLQSITYNYREPSSSSPALIPDVEVVLSDKYETIANPIATLSGEVSALTKQIGAMSNVEQVVRAIGDKLYLRKDGIADRSMSPTEFASLVKGRDFRSGIVGGASWGIYQDANGNWVVEADRFKARQDFEVNNLVINQIIARGGMIIESAAQIEVTHVDETEDGYVCYFDQKMGSVANLFHVDDVAYCNRFTPENTALKFYKRRVIEVSADSITLTDGYESVQLPDGTTDTGKNGDGIPEVGDTIIQYGNYTDPSRRYVKVRDVINGGYERYLEGLDSVNANGKEYYFAGKQDGQNPRWFIGDKNGQYAEWKDNRLHINADLVIGPDSSGLGNLAEWGEAQNAITSAESNANDALIIANEAKNQANAANQTIDDVRYLKEAFKQDTTIISGGVALGSFIGVKNSGGQVVAGMSGKNFINKQIVNGKVVGTDFTEATAESCPMIYAGATSAANANTAKTRIYPNGKLATESLEAKQAKIDDSTLTNVSVNGTIRSPFQPFDGNINIDLGGDDDDEENIDYNKFDNVTCGNDSAGWGNGGFDVLKWDNSQNGRTLTFVNYKCNGILSKAALSLSVPDNSPYSFFENGTEHSKIVIRKGELVQLKGYGEGNNFYGWIVLSRAQLPGHMPDILYEGIVENGILTKWRSWDNKKLTVSTVSTGFYKIEFPDGVSIAPSNYTVMLTGWIEPNELNTNGVYASLYSKTSASFQVRTADDDSANNGRFTFQVINTANWNS